MTAETYSDSIFSKKTLKALGRFFPNSDALDSRIKELRAENPDMNKDQLYHLLANNGGKGKAVSTKSVKGQGWSDR